jgi:hypothetical protein
MIIDVEELARLLHLSWCEKDSQSCDLQGGLCSALNVEWDKLPAFYQESNRASVRDISEKLLQLGLTLDRSSDKPALALSDAELVQLSRMEHERWCRERVSAGWVFGLERDDALKIHPDLVPYEHLSTEKRQLDTDKIVVLLALLSERGIVPVESI